MTDIGDTDYEYDGGYNGSEYYTPDSPRKATARFSDAEKSYSNAAFNSNSARSVEELSNEEELLVIVSLIGPDFQWKRARVRTLVPRMISLVFRTAASWPDP